MEEKKEIPRFDDLKKEAQKEWRKELKKAIPVKERMKIPRQKMPEREHDVRNKDFFEVNLGLSPDQAVEEARRCLDCPNPFCVIGCPVAIDIPSFIKLIEIGKFSEAARKIKETNSLPAICGRVCPQESQCEVQCIVFKSTGVSVAIGNLERFVADWEREKEEILIPQLANPTGKRVAIVGAGPAGLTVAGELSKKGHSVTVFEALHKSGGVLAYGIPEFRLPKRILDAEVDYLKKLGVEILNNFVVGRTATIDDLKKEGYEAFFIGSGAGLPTFMNAEGENLNGIYSANEYLTRINLMRAFEFPNYDTPLPKGKRVAVIGGGNTAMDSVRSAKRLGAEWAAIVYRRTRKEMPARVEEVKHAEEEGIEFLFLTLPVKFIEDERGWVKEMECLRMELGEPDASGRRRPIPIKGSEFRIEVDLVINAVGTSPNPLIPQTTKGIEVGKWGTIKVDFNTMATSIEGIYAGGDIVRGGATVILAMGDGRMAAYSIDLYLKNKNSR
ncbi:MAG: NADPH-dependent glutamate synthase [Acidobacteriota bacterium]